MKAESKVEPLVNVMIAMPETSLASSEARTRANSLVVATDNDYATAGEILLEIKRLRKERDDQRKKLLEPIYEARDRVMALFNPSLTEFDDCERIVKGKLIDYSKAQEKRRIEEQAKADAAARKERERVEQQAKKAADAGKVEKAEALVERAATVVAPIIEREAPKVKGVSLRSVWLYEIVDESQIPLQYRPIDERLISATVRVQKQHTRIPGIRVWEDKTIAAGGGK